MTALLTDNLPLLAGAPNGIKKLRELILELAVRGKLVPQDPNDEPASELLKRIADEKARLVAEGRGRKQKPLTAISGYEKPFQLSDGWEWVRLGEIAEVIRGVTYGKSESSEALLFDYAPLLRANNINRVLNFERLVFVPKRLIADQQYVRRGDVVVAMSSGSADLVGKAAQAEDDYEGAFGAFCGVVRSRAAELIPFFGFFFQTHLYRRGAAGHGKGIGINNLQKSVLEALEIPLPPLAEQHRIVAKVDELMALCDRLEARQADAESAHAQLVQALLDSLAQARDAEDFARSWQRLAGHFHTLFTTESSIDALKQALLQLAVMGKLMPQDPNDEPASELLKQIAKETARLVAQGKLKKQKPLAGIKDEEQLFELPSNWGWARFGNICAIKGELVRPEDFPLLRQIAPDCIEKGTGRITDNRTVKESGVKGPNSRFFAGQIVYSKIRPSLSKAVLVDFDGLCSADMYPVDAFISSEFLLKVILSEVFLEQVRVAENRIKMPKLNQESLRGFVLPIPPLAEQHRIVAKVDELMALCDQVKARLNQARQVHEQLASALVERAVA